MLRQAQHDRIVAVRETVSRGLRQIGQDLAQIIDLPQPRRDLVPTGND
jgi:hypothetical protein